MATERVTKALSIKPKCTPSDTVAPEWLPNTNYTVPTLVRYQGQLYKLLQNHTSSIPWRPTETPALWVIPTPCGITEWQPQTEYGIGSRVTYKLSNYVCIQAHSSQNAWNPPATPALWNQFYLIQAIDVSKNPAKLGETITITVQLNPDIKGIGVMINGSPGTTQKLQFTDYVGNHRVHVLAVNADRLEETRFVDIKVERADFFVPQIQVSCPDIREVTFSVPDPTTYVPIDATYNWDLGPVGAWVARESSITVSLQEALRPDRPYTTFDVSLRITWHNNGLAEAARTFTFWNRYVLEKMRGLIKPIVTYDHHIRPGSDSVPASCDIHNIEDENIYLSKKSTQYLWENPETRPVFNAESEDIDVEIGPDSKVSVDCTLPNKLPRAAAGFIVHLSGSSASGKQVRVSCYFETGSQAEARVVSNPIVIEALKEMRTKSNNPAKESFTRNELEAHLASQPGGISKTVRSALGEPTNVLPRHRQLTRGAAGDGSLEREPCFPDQSPPEDDLACVLQEEYKDVWLPPRIVNAFKGDIIITHGDGSPFCNLFRHVNDVDLSDPETLFMEGLYHYQPYSHCGIMTQNHYEVRHCYMSQDRLLNYLRGEFLGVKGTDGVEPDKLRYGWPGAITQTVDEAFKSTYREDPESGLTFWFAPFSFHAGIVDGQVVEPLVMKVDPFAEVQNPAYRDKVMKIADHSKDINAHYRPFANSDGFISDTSRNNPQIAPDRPGWWASGSIPASSATYLRACVKSEQPPVLLEGKTGTTTEEDIEEKDKKLGAAIVPSGTADGLYKYAPPERRCMATWLYNVMYNKANEKVEIPGPSGLVGDAADDWGNQFANAFIFGNEDDKDEDNWRYPGTTSTVTPSDLLFWDAPSSINALGEQFGLYGYSEKLIYREGEYQYRQISRWVREPKKSDVAGYVYWQGIAVEGATVIIGGQSVPTDASGHFTITKVPVGHSQIVAGKEVPYQYDTGSVLVWAEGKAAVDIVENVVAAVDITLEYPPNMYREITITGNMYGVDTESGDDEYPEPNPQVFSFNKLHLGPDKLHLEDVWDCGWGGECYTKFRWWLDYVGGDVTFHVIAELWESTDENPNGDPCDTDDRTLIIKKDETLKPRYLLINPDGKDKASYGVTITNTLRP
ncbi:hypothetical protein K432DRAFT_387616 [Lepidopterella palustris CBS 459.81]|uniref:Chitin-binding type-3 domain-containing protein n=1 Tax=Lepidopterella palustris CBS 459.81 TaxID=1314670 RepID=A0A8E2J8R4_9PEZI|nr:hypothetical protein K432DRAFT_387616 [Lepidopterella palustris CBS 459.81]